MTDLVVVEKLEGWEKLKTLVLDSVSSPITKRVLHGPERIPGMGSSRLPGPASPRPPLARGGYRWRPAASDRAP